MLIMLRNDWPAETFRRGGLVFHRGNPVECDAESVKNDLGKSLLLVHPGTAKADHDLTSDFLNGKTPAQSQAGPDEHSHAEPASARTTDFQPVAVTETAEPQTAEGGHPTETALGAGLTTPPRKRR